MENKYLSKVKDFLNSTLLELRSLLILVAFVIFASIVTYFLYKHTEEILKHRLQERLIAITATAAVQFDAAEIIDVALEGDINSKSLSHLVEQLSAIREANENIKFAYIMRRTEDPNVFAFVADADMLTALEELDENKNGELDEEETPPQPGDPYPVDDYPVLRDEAFLRPSVDKTLQPDQWGLIMAAYAPILNESGEPIAIIGLDVIVNDFKEKTQETLLPFILYISFLVTILTLLTILLVRFWRDRVEALRELDRQKDELLGIVSHQLAAPVTAIKWYLELLTDSDIGSLKKEQLESLKSMQSITGDLSDLINMILDVSRIQLGRMKIDPQPLDLNQFFVEVLQIIEPRANEKKINFEKKISSELPTVLLDKRLTRMTIENLLTNAIKYTPEKGQVKLLVEKRGEALYCEVQDTGCGIPKSEQGKAFDKLFRASNVRNKIEGNGFGLYAAKGAIEVQDGKIWFKSIEGKGTTFFVELPLKFPAKN